MSAVLLSLALAVSSTGTPTLTREQKYRQAALMNAAAATALQGRLEECQFDLDAERLIAPANLTAIPSPAIPPILWGLAGLGLGAAVGLAVGVAVSHD